MGYRQSEAAPIGDGYLNPRKCPVCGKTFIPAPMHSYHKNEDEAEPLVCTWKCARAGQGYERTRRKHVMKTDRRPKRKRYVYTVVNTQTGETVCRDALIRQLPSARRKRHFTRCVRLRTRDSSDAGPLKRKALKSISGRNDVETPKRRYVAHEGNEQEALFSWALYAAGAMPELGLMFHVPNGGSRNRIEAAKLKRQGVRAGVPDICLPVARGGFHGLFVELKYGRNKATDRQTAWLDALRSQGYLAVECVGWDTAREVITKYLKGEIKNGM